MRRIVEAALDMIRVESINLLFAGLGLAPEGELMPPEAVQLMYEACRDDAATMPPFWTSAVACRAALSGLLATNLLQGSIDEGVTLHSVVREYARSKLGSEEDIITRQRVFLGLVNAARPRADWPLGHPLSAYVRHALPQHMKEALAGDGAEALSCATKCVDASDDPFHSMARCIGTFWNKDQLQQLAEKLEIEKQHRIAAKVYAIMSVHAPPGKSNDLLARALALLEQSSADIRSRTVQLCILLHQADQIGSTDPRKVVLLQAVDAVSAQGTSLTAPSHLFKLAWSLELGGLARVGCFGVAAGAHLNADSWNAMARACETAFAHLFQIESTTDSGNPAFLVAKVLGSHIACYLGLFSRDDHLPWLHEALSLARLRWIDSNCKWRLPGFVFDCAVSVHLIFF